MVGFSLGFGSIPFLLMGEIFPSKQRGMLSSIAISFNVAAMFTVIKTFHSLETVNFVYLSYLNALKHNISVQILTSAGTFWMYSVFCALGVVFVIFCVPETKGRELDSMALVFRKSFRVLAGKSRNSSSRPPMSVLMQNGGQRNAAFSAAGEDGRDGKVIESTKC